MEKEREKQYKGRVHPTETWRLREKPTHSIEKREKAGGVSALLV